MVTVDDLAQFLADRYQEAEAMARAALNRGDGTWHSGCTHEDTNNCWCHDGDIDNDPYDGDDDPRCTHCNGEIWVECDDPIQCCDPRCDGELHPDPACGGTGLYEHQVIF